MSYEEIVKAYWKINKWLWHRAVIYHFIDHLKLLEEEEDKTSSRPKVSKINIKETVFRGTCGKV